MKNIVKTIVNPKVSLKGSVVQLFRTNKYDNKTLKFIGPDI